MRGVVLASQRFNGENAWMLKRKWVECWDISREFWVHYLNFNGAGAGRGWEFWGNRSGIVWCFQQRLKVEWTWIRVNYPTNDIQGLTLSAMLASSEWRIMGLQLPFTNKSIPRVNFPHDFDTGWVLVCESKLSMFMIHRSSSNIKCYL